MARTILVLAVVSVLALPAGADTPDDPDFHDVAIGTGVPTPSSNHVMGRHTWGASRVFFDALIPQEDERVTVAFAGDTLIHNTVTAAARDGNGFDSGPCSHRCVI